MAQACKFRHVYGQAAKPDHQFLELPNPLTSGEGPYVKASHKYLAFSSTSVRRLYVRPLEHPGRFSRSECHISLNCLKGKIWDFDFHPFNDDLLAMGDDNGKCAIVSIPDTIDTLGSLESNISDAKIDLGTIHNKKVILIQFHPCANNILSTGSFDRTVKIFDIIKNNCINKIDGFGDTIYSMEWNSNGSMIGISSKDKTIRCIDPRSFKSGSNSDGNGVIINKAFDGVKSSKTFWISNKNFIGATGFSKFAKRQLKLWDLRKTDKGLINYTLDQASSILMPRYDESNNLLYLAGKGDGTVSYGEFRDNFKKYFCLGTYRSPEPQRGGGWVPKRGLNVWKCEIERFLKLTRKSIVPVSFIVPRKAGSDIFQSDIYPDINSSVPSMTSDEWINGNNKMPLLTSMDPELKDKIIENKNKIVSNGNLNSNSNNKEEKEDTSINKQKQQAKETVRTTKEVTEKPKPKEKENKIETKDNDEKNNENDQLGDLPKGLNLTKTTSQDSVNSINSPNSDIGNVSTRSRDSTGSVMIRPSSETPNAKTEELEKQNKQLENENTGLKVQVEQLNSTNKILETEKSQLTQENSLLKDELEKLKQRLKELEKSKKKKTDKTKEEASSSSSKNKETNDKDKENPAFAETSIWEDSDDN